MFRRMLAKHPGLDIGNGIYIETDEGWLYLAVVLDLYARKVVGWAMVPTMHAELVCAALRVSCTAAGFGTATSPQRSWHETSESPFGSHGRHC